MLSSPRPPKTSRSSSISFQRSADVLVMLVLGGAGRLYGGLVGAMIFMVARDQFSGIAPQYWYFWIGVLLITVVMVLPNGIVGGLSRNLRTVGTEMSSTVLAAKDVATDRAIALATRGLTKSFGSLPVARNIEINLPVGARYALIGPNGAGKTTLINLMTGMLAPNAGQILLGGEDITGLGPQDRVRRGLARTFQINTLFAGLNALEAVTLAVLERRGLSGQFWRGLGSHAEAIDEAYEILRKLRLGDSCYQVTRELPYGRQRLLEIALALATRPKVLLLDEPAAGVPQEESGEVFEAVASLSDDLTLLFIEHDMHVVFRFASHIIVLVGGAIFTEGSPAEIAADPGVREVYLGKRKHG